MLSRFGARPVPAVITCLLAVLVALALASSEPVVAAAGDTPSVAGSSSLVEAPGIGPVELDPTRRCDDLDPAHCLLPFPNDHFTVADHRTDTAQRINLSTLAMPRNVAGKPINPSEWNRNDGFSPGQPVMAFVPGLDLHQTWETTDRPHAGELDTPEYFDFRDHIADIGMYAREDAPIVIINAETGERHPFWSELDLHHETPDHERLLILRPAENFDHATRYVVALRNLKDSSGETISPGEPFRRYRDGDADLLGLADPRWWRMQRVFRELDEAGVSRDDLYLAWDFTVISQRNMAERVLALRDDAFGQLGDHDLASGIVEGDAPGFVVDDIEEHDDGEHGRYRRVRGRITVPNYLDRPQNILSAIGPNPLPVDVSAPVSRLYYGPDGLTNPDAAPRQNPLQPTVEVTYTCDLPLDGGPAYATLYGHGLLGTQDQIGDARWPRRHGFSICATDWWGMSTSDLPTVAAIIADVSHFPALADRAQQGFLNFMFLGRAMVHPDGFTAHEAFTQDGTLLIATATEQETHLYFDGNSQGGIMGGSLVAISPDIRRGFLGVPGMNYSTLLNRSVDWEGAYGELFYLTYQDPMERQLGMSLIQMLWDRAESNGYAHHMTTDPLRYPDGSPATPPHEVMLQVAWSDHQVTVHAAEVMARTIGAPIMVPGLEDDRRHWEMEPYHTPTATYPYAGSAMIYWDSGNARPPNGNIPARHLRDPHGDPRRDPAGGWQETYFLLTGVNIDVCDERPYLTSQHPAADGEPWCDPPEDQTLPEPVAPAMAESPQVAAEVETDPLDPAWHAEIDDALLHGTVTPPGQRMLDFDSERVAYDSLVQGYPTLTLDELIGRYFKDGLFGPVDDPARTYSPRSDVTIVRDGDWHVPVIYGETDEAMAFGAGFITVEDRLPIMELLRALGRAEAFQLLETAPAWLADAEVARLYGYTQEELEGMVDRLPEVYGRDGADAKAILEAYVQGINYGIAEIARGQLPFPAGLSDLGIDLPAPWTTGDVVAAVGLVRALFGAGGGAEMDNAARLLSLMEQFGEEQGVRVYEDFRSRMNLDGPFHTEQRFPYMEIDHDALDPEANVLAYGAGAPGLQARLEQLIGSLPGGVSQASDQFADLAERSRIRWENLAFPEFGLDLSSPGSMSNYIVVDGSWTTNGRPILLGGPQTGYFSPQILLEYELHSPTIHARGAGFPALSTLVIIGRTQDYAWTPTAGGGDMIDHKVVELCEPDGSEPTEASLHYRYDGDCVAMDRRLIRRVDDVVPIDLPGRDLLSDIYAERTIHGPVVARGQVGDTPVAVAHQRSTYLRELDPAISILRMNRNEATTGQDFVDIFTESHNLSTNWAYANRDEIAYVHGGLYPIRPREVHPDFPVWGDGRFEWEGFVPPEGHPHEVAPESGYVISWNNAIAPGWSASDAQWGWSSVYRSLLLEDLLLEEERGSIDPVRLTQIMMQAGLADLRGTHVYPMVLRVMEAGTPPNERAEVMAGILQDWIAEGALRRDGDGDGVYDHTQAVAIADEWWVPLIRAVFDPVIGDAAAVSREGFHNAPGMQGSAFQGGYYGYVWTQMAMLLGEEVASPTSQAYCGADEPGVDGTLEACAERLWAALDAAGAALAGDRGDDPHGWRADEDGDRIQFIPAVTHSMHWQNRPTTQGIAMFGARPDPPAVDPPVVDPPPLPATGGGGVAVAVLALVLAISTVVHRRWRLLRLSAQP